MSTLPLSRTCRRCRAIFHIMPHRLTRLPGAGELCPACRFLGEAADQSPEIDDIPPPRRTWPCRLCGRHSANRLYCPEHLEALSAELGYDPGDFGLEDRVLPLAMRSHMQREAAEELGVKEEQERPTE
ncbi:hypothetical protein [Megalodesulfovibrio gigas]|uniref:Uncharacterized protein n=1 Tax=Megalodesulfovibrio gigas (strain ATCC 19364 / DSM 1382 / NCIMB 9332 / VKM B-1759) TaxID=1121448 RepID=T2GEP9_MEGG1|nr:hypothetical protein [Megalodesulfovibrio gigas]AGW14639.1 hypothetical protein DGI_2913 [Megalodesulfovibrio gigas DSM 1382 = ATCC 19364]